MPPSLWVSVLSVLFLSIFVFLYTFFWQQVLGRDSHTDTDTEYLEEHLHCLGLMKTRRTVQGIEQHCVDSGERLTFYSERADGRSPCQCYKNAAQTSRFALVHTHTRTHSRVKQRAIKSMPNRERERERAIDTALLFRVQLYTEMFK